tara:strand:+ start:618 stop:779 length:162 start_codon:yes stop_codon:yes gene_type:complete
MLSLEDILKIRNTIEMRDQLIRSLAVAEEKIKNLEKKIDELTNTAKDVTKIKV